jgi:tetratricopeptide (TPR) repeat protein
VFFFILTFFVFTGNIQSQNKVIDSLKTKLDSHKKNDTLRINLINQLALEYSNSNNETAIDLVTQANNLSKKIKYKKGEAKSLFVFSKIYILKSEIDKAKENADKALKIYEKINDLDGISNTYSVLGTISFYSNDSEKALNYYTKALKIAKQTDDKKGQASFITNIGNISYAKGDLDEAVINYKDAITIYEAINDNKGIFKTFNNIAVIFLRQGRSIEALEYFNKCLKISKEQDDMINVAAINLNMGAVYSDRKKYEKALVYIKESLAINEKLDNKIEISKGLIALGRLFAQKEKNEKALEYYLRALTINEEIDNNNGLSLCYSNVASLYLKMDEPKKALITINKCIEVSKEDKRVLSIANIILAKAYFMLEDYSEALKKAKIGKQIADELELLEQQKEVNELLSKIYEKKGDFKKAYLSYQNFKVFNDSLFNKENIEKFTELEYEYKYKQELESANNRELKLTKTVKDTSENLIKSQRNLLLGIVAFLVVSLLLGGVIFFLKLRNEKEKTQNIVIEQKLLRSQMTPHFIFNSLSVLQGMILNKEERKSVSYLSKFSKLLRITLENSRDKLVSLEQELTAVENYLALQNLENEAYEYSVSTEEIIDSTKFQVPPMLIQPFVENAIEHAFGNQTGNKKIDVYLKYSNKNLICTIADNGSGINLEKDKSKTNKKSLSTTITAERLSMLAKDFKMKGSVTVQDRKQFNEQGTIITLVIPHKINEA